MAEPLAPQEIARRTFSVARRGYEQQEVRGFLHEVSALLERSSRTESELRERAERAEAKLGLAAEPDEAMLLEVLGEETTRVLTSAREAAGEIRSKAEQAAERIIAEATTEAAELRGRAVHDADALMAETRSESDSILEAARTELDRRQAEAAEEAARVAADAQAQAERVLAEAEAEAARRREEAEEAVEAARQQGREMVAEAQAVRERVLRDLVSRRKKARQQVEKLSAGRERLLQAYDVVRRTIDEATGELNVSLLDARIAADSAARRIEDEADPTFEQLDQEVADAALIDLPIVALDHEDDDTPGPFSGEVPAVATEDAGEALTETAPVEGGAEATTDSSPALSTAVPVSTTESSSPPAPERRTRKSRRKKGFEGLPAGALTVVEPGGPDEGVRILAEAAEPAEAVEPEDEAEEDRARTVEVADEPAEAAQSEDHDETEVRADGAERVDVAGEPVGDDAKAAAPGSEAEGTEARADAEGDVRSDEGSTVDGGGAPPPPAKADDVFARLRAGHGAGDVGTADAAATGEGVAEPRASEPESATVEPSPDETAFDARAAAIGAAEKDLSRRLKRVLADEQNEVLDLLRRAKPKGAEDLLPSPDDHAARWAESAMEVLDGAAAAGAGWSGGEASSAKGLATELAESLTVPLRDRIERSFSASDGNLDEVTDRVRALYREWKGKRLTESAEHFVMAAYARGVFDGVEGGSPVRWALDPSVAACPDCDDNVLAGAIAKGEAFPTGSPCAPAHTGCHCLVLPAGG